MKALALLLACTLWETSVLAQDREAEQIAQVRAEFTGKSLVEINGWLAAIRPVAVSSAEQQILLRDLPLITQANSVADYSELFRLRTRLEAALGLHGRAGVIEL